MVEKKRRRSRKKKEEEQVEPTEEATAEENQEEETPELENSIRLVRRYDQLLPVELTPDEIRAKGSELAEAHKRLRVLEQEKKDAMSAWKLRLERASSEIDRLATIVHDGSEERAVACQEEADLTEKKMRVLRLDTGEVTSVRALSLMELESFNQTRLFGDDADQVQEDAGDPPVDAGASDPEPASTEAKT